MAAMQNLKIADLMARKRITANKLATEVGISKAMMTFIIQGKKDPSVEVAARMAQVLGTSLDEIVKKPD